LFGFGISRFFDFFGGDYWIFLFLDVLIVWTFILGIAKKLNWLIY